jgi:hypothetical protein
MTETFAPPRVTSERLSDGRLLLRSIEPLAGHPVGSSPRGRLPLISLTSAAAVAAVHHVYRLGPEVLVPGVIITVAHTCSSGITALRGAASHYGATLAWPLWSSSGSESSMASSTMSSRPLVCNTRPCYPAARRLLSEPPSPSGSRKLATVL